MIDRRMFGSIAPECEQPGAQEASAVISRTEFAACVGEENLRTVASSAVDSLRLPESSKRFLVNVGLPRKGPLLLEFDFEQDCLQSLSEYVGSRALLGTRGTTLRRIGTDYGTQLCLDEAQEGCLVSIDTHGNLPERLVNSSVEQFAACLVVYLKVARAWTDRINIDAQQLAAQAKVEISAIDANAIASEENWWSLIYEQVRAGLL